MAVHPASAGPQRPQPQGPREIDPSYFRRNFRGPCMRPSSQWKYSSGQTVAVAAQRDATVTVPEEEKLLVAIDRRTMALDETDDVYFDFLGVLLSNKTVCNATDKVLLDAEPAKYNVSDDIVLDEVFNELNETRRKLLVNRQALWPRVKYGKKMRRMDPKKLKANFESVKAFEQEYRSVYIEQGYGTDNGYRTDKPSQLTWHDRLHCKDFNIEDEPTTFIAHTSHIIRTVKEKDDLDVMMQEARYKRNGSVFKRVPRTLFAPLDEEDEEDVHPGQFTRRIRVDPSAYDNVSMERVVDVDFCSEFTYEQRHYNTGPPPPTPPPPPSPPRPAPRQQQATARTTARTTRTTATVSAVAPRRSVRIAAAAARANNSGNDTSTAQQQQRRSTPRRSAVKPKGFYKV